MSKQTKTKSKKNKKDAPKAEHRHAQAWVERQLAEAVQPLRISAKEWLGIWTLEQAMDDGFWDIPTMMERLLWVRPDDDLVEEAGRIADKHGISRDSSVPQYQRIMITERLTRQQSVLLKALRDFDPADPTPKSSIKLVSRAHALKSFAA